MDNSNPVSDRLREYGETIQGTWESENSKFYYQFEDIEGALFATLYSEEGTNKIPVEISEHRGMYFIDLKDARNISFQIEYISDTIISLREVNTLIRDTLFRKDFIPYFSK